MSRHNNDDNIESESDAIVFGAFRNLNLRGNGQQGSTQQNPRLQIQRPYGQSGHVSVLEAKKGGNATQTGETRTSARRLTNKDHRLVNLRAC
jgi:hypothetical protein